MKKLITSLFAVALIGLTGCTTNSLAKKLSDFEKLGITEAQVTGKFSNTEYKVTDKDGVRRAELDHSNAWVPKVHIVRETKKE